MIRWKLGVYNRSIGSVGFRVSKTRATILERTT